MSRFEIYLSKNDLEHIANGHDIKIKIVRISFSCNLQVSKTRMAKKYSKGI